MWLVSGIGAADIDDPQPGTVIAGRIEADNLGAPFKLGALIVMQVLDPAAQVSRGGLYILDDGSDVAMCGHRASRPTFG
jgi:altronate dehydratase